MLTTCLTHIYNEEYLLPLWLNHHKTLFDNIVIIDYRSTDRSLEICKTICPDCKIITTRNSWFDARLVDDEVMDIEKTIEGIKIVLNTTEFLFCEKPISEIVLPNTSLSIVTISPYSNTEYNINDAFSNLLNNDMTYHYDRDCYGPRQIHSFLHGNYKLGRHGTHNSTSPTNDLHIIWFGFYPFNQSLLDRKLQIQNNIPQSDKDNGLGFQHLYTIDKIRSLNKEKADSGSQLQSINLSLYNLLLTYKRVGECVYIQYPELLNMSYTWGENYIMLNNDINLLSKTEFDNVGYNILDIDNYNALLRRFIKNEIKLITNKDIELDNYSELTDTDHKLILNAMPFKKNMYPDICEFCNYIEAKISGVLGEKVTIFNDDLWVRICRPNSNADFNPCHRDVYLDFYRNTVNIYLPIMESDLNSSLKIQPGSHKWNENETIVTKGGAYFKSTGKKYSVDAIVASKKRISMIRPNPREDQMMLFSPYLIHGCSNNTNNKTRMSLEVRFIRDSEKIQEASFNEFVKHRNWR